MVVRSFHLSTGPVRWFQPEGRRRSPSRTRPSSSGTPGGRGWSGCPSLTTSGGMSGNLSRPPWRVGLRRETLPLKYHFHLSLNREMLWFCKISINTFSLHSSSNFKSMLYDLWKLVTIVQLILPSLYVKESMECTFFYVLWMHVFRFKCYNWRFYPFYQV